MSQVKVTNGDNVHNKVVLLTDIFGHTDAVDKLSASIGNVDVLSPYPDNASFTNEQQAYAYFTKNIGIERYLLRLQEYLAANGEPKVFVGFSVGAAVLWQYAALANITAEYAPSKVLAFYGGQIRHHLQRVPNIPVEAVFASMEKHFDVESVMSVIGQYKNVQLHHCEFLHGFMNHYSDNFDEHGYQKYLHWIISHC